MQSSPYSQSWQRPASTAPAGGVRRLSGSHCRKQAFQRRCHPAIHLAAGIQQHLAAAPVQPPAAAASQQGISGGVSFPDPAVGRNIVVAVDGTEDCINAFHWALRHLYRQGDRMTVLHVMPDGNSGPASGSIYYYPGTDPEVERCLWTQAKEFIQENFVEAGKAKAVEVEVVLVKERHRGVAWALCRKAEELGAQPLVLAAHDKSPLEEMLMGSTSKFCVAHCRQPVLLLHGGS